MIWLILGAITCFLASVFGTKLTLNLLRKYKVLDLPNARSNHKIPTPRGGGIAALLVMLAGFALINWHFGESLNSYMLIIAGFILATISFYDDLKSSPILLRLAGQITAVVLVLFFYPEPKILPFPTPLFIDYIFGFLFLMWFINFFNFMDGIDGITASQSTYMAFAFAIIYYLLRMPLTDIYFFVVILTASLGFLIYNWHPAKLFMGDVLSTSYGLILGFFTLKLVSYGYIFPALIIPLYYYADSGYTLCWRLIKGERIFESHSQHFYQQAARKGFSHSKIVNLIIIVNLCLLVLGLYSIMGPLQGLISLLIAIILVAWLLRYFSFAKKR